MARAATAPELALFRTAGQWSKLRAAVFAPATVYTARVNQAFATWDQVLEITYDTGSGTLADVLPDMTLLIGSTAGAHDLGIVRIRDKDATKFYIGETSDVAFADNQYLTVVNDFSLWARPVLHTGGVAYMDGGIAYTDQHTKFDPVPIMGSHRVLKLTGATVAASFDGSASYVYDSTISTYAWSAPGSSASSGMATATPTITWNSVGWKVVYLTLTAANGKSFFGVRYVYIWNDANLPAKAKISECRTDADSGGWSFEVTLTEGATLTTIRDRALVILFAEDYYGSTQQSIGAVVGSENILVTGWIAKETITFNPLQGMVRFTGYTAQYWFSAIPSWPDGVEFVTHAAESWVEIQQLTINKGLYHFLRWRSTATRIMDVFLTDRTDYALEITSLALNLWEQIRELGFLSVFARAGVNALNQLFIEVHPQLVPTGSRTWPTVMTILKEDWKEEIDFERRIVLEAALVSLSGFSVDASRNALAFFALSAGHAFSSYGKPDLQDKLLVSSQAQANTLCGLYYGWKNNAYPDIPIRLRANNRLIDCFPRQKCAVSIAPGDTPRGITYAGNLIPTSVAYIQNDETGEIHTEVNFEGETFPGLSVNGDVPGSGDLSIPPVSSFPDFPAFPILLPGIPEPSVEGAQSVLMHCTTYGVLYSSDFDAAGPHWITCNAGLTAYQYQNINCMFVCPNGSLYVAYLTNESGASIGGFIARAPSIGAPFVIVEDKASILAKEGGTLFTIRGLAYNSLVPESVCYILQGTATTGHAYIGAALTYAQGYNFTNFGLNIGGYETRKDTLSYGFGKWLFHGFASSTQHIWVLNAGATALSASYSMGGLGAWNVVHRIGTTGKFFIIKPSPHQLHTFDNNDPSVTTIVNSPPATLYSDGWAHDPTGMYIMARYDVGVKGKSTDGGATFTALASLPVGANWRFANAGTTQRFVAANGTTVRSTEDFGTTWINKEGYLLSTIGVTVLNMIVPVVY